MVESCGLRTVVGSGGCRMWCTRLLILLGSWTTVVILLFAGTWRCTASIASGGRSSKWDGGVHWAADLTSNGQGVVLVTCCYLLEWGVQPSPQLPFPGHLRSGGGRIVLFICPGLFLLHLGAVLFQFFSTGCRLLLARFLSGIGLIGVQVRYLGHLEAATTNFIFIQRRITSIVIERRYKHLSIFAVRHGLVWTRLWKDGGYQLLMVLLHLYVGILISCYNLLLYLFYPPGSPYLPISNLIWAIFYAIQLVVFITCTHRTKMQADHSRHILLRHQRSYGAVLNNDIELFLLNTEPSSRHVISAKGFLSIHPSIIGDVFKSIVTQLVIIMTFEKLSMVVKCWRSGHSMEAAGTALASIHTRRHHHRTDRSRRKHNQCSRPFKSTIEAMRHVTAHMSQLECRTKAKETDLLFLKSLMEDPQLQATVKAQDKLEEDKANLEPVSTGNVQLAKELSATCRISRNRSARELGLILNKPHIKALLETHDTVAVATSNGSGGRVWESAVGSQVPLVDYDHQEAVAMETIKVVGFRKNPNEPLGVTVEVNGEGHLVVARILAGGAIERQGLLKPGDTILEVNEVTVASPEQLQNEVALAHDALTFRVIPTAEPTPGPRPNKTYMRALFSYDPKEDTLLPCKEIGLAFNRGDILQIVNQKDPNWWQAKKVGSNGPAGLIPSQELEERRKAFVKPEADYVHKISICGARISKKKRKILYQTKMNSEFDKAELVLYEEVARMPPFKRRTLALIGSHGVGRRTLKNRLINSDPDKFGSVIPLTSRPPRELEENGKSYWFVSQEAMEKNVREHRLLESGEHNGYLYGTSLESVRDVIHQGKMCVLDCSPGALKILHNSSEFMPYVIFIAAPGMELLKQLYDFNRSTGVSSRYLTFDRQSSIRFSSRRARTLESLASLYEEDEFKRTVEESSALQRAYEKYIDLIIVNEDFDVTFRKVVSALETLSTEHQFVPVNWVY